MPGTGAASGAAATGFGAGAGAFPFMASIAMPPSTTTPKRLPMISALLFFGGGPRRPPPSSSSPSSRPARPFDRDEPPVEAVPRLFDEPEPPDDAREDERDDEDVRGEGAEVAGEGDDGAAGAASAAGASRKPERSITVWHPVQVNVAGGRSGSLNFFEHVGHWIICGMGRPSVGLGPSIGVGGGIVGPDRATAQRMRTASRRDGRPRARSDVRSLPVAPPLAVVFRSLSQLHGAGVAWPEALHGALGRREAPGTTGDAWDGAIAAVRAGSPLSVAVSGLVPPVDRAGIRAAESSGRMEELLAGLAKRHEDIDRRRQAERGALAYPLLMAHIAAFLMMIPDLAQGRTGAALRWALLILIPTHLFLWARRRLRRADETGTTVAGWLGLFRTKALVDEADAKSIASLGWLHEAGVPPLEALPLAAAAGIGGRASADLVDAYNEVSAGRPIHGAWTRIPEDLRSALVTGEVAGRLGEACERAARTLDESAAHRREVAFARMKPIVILVLGAIIGYRVISFYSDAMKQAMSFKY